MELSSVFGEVEKNPGIDERYLVPGTPEVQVIGNVRGEDGELRAMYSQAPPLPNGDDIQYCPDLRSPIWHTDQAFRDPPPLASLLFCKSAPPAGGDTCFADCVTAYEALPQARKAELDNLSACCSYAHHNAKVQLRSPNYPLLTAEQRVENPPVYQQIVRESEDGSRSIYGFNSSVCAVLPTGERASQEALDIYDLTGEEDASVQELLYRDLLPFVTQPSFTYRHVWQPGDLVIWDNLRTIHAATPFETSHDREMWRTTVASSR